MLTSGLEVGIAREWELRDDARSPSSAAFFSPRGHWVSGTEEPCVVRGVPYFPNHGMAICLRPRPRKIRIWGGKGNLRYYKEKISKNLIRYSK